MSEYDATQAFYGRWARLYDRLATAPGVRSWRAAAADALALSPGDTVVEMGVGTGANLPHLRERVGSEGRVVGVDLTRGMLDVAAGRIADAGWQNVSLVRADARRPPIDEPIDAVLASFVVGMFEAPDRAVESWIDRVVAGGRVALLDAARSSRPVARPLNLAFRAFVRLTAPRGGATVSSRHTRSPVASLEERIDAANEALWDSSATREQETVAGGFVRLRWGRARE
jgi:ubiquinone/menaquinone biosynthesis C-methylase UbiE